MPEDVTDLAELRRAAACCQGCELFRRATATVFGEGDRDAQLVLVGEQPGDREDREGAPFVGPAGHLLDQALEQAGIDRSTVYVTNAVKHFKWEPRGSRRLHKKPSRAEVRACQPWLQAEIVAVAPRLVCCLGSTAAEAVIGPGFQVTKHRGELLEVPNGGPGVVATVHPSSVLRGPPEDRQRNLAAFVSDLSAVARHVGR
ncbi:MAG: UdgX family uracil-DNA binding protein [Acidimicrobiales bacterium]